MSFKFGCNDSPVYGQWNRSGSGEDTDGSVYSSGRSDLDYASSISSLLSGSAQDREDELDLVASTLLKQQETRLEKWVLEEEPEVPDQSKLPTSEPAVGEEEEVWTWNDRSRVFELRESRLRAHHQRDKFVCLQPGCTSKYSRAADLERHYRTLHANVERLDCPRLNCSRKGDNGFTRRDHLTEHLRYYHGYEYSQKPARADTPFEAKLPEPLSEISDEDIDKVVKCSRLQCRNVFLKRHDFTKHVQSHIDSNLERAKGKSPDTRKGDCMEPFSETLLGNADKSTSDSAMSQEPHRMLTVSPDENSGNVGYSTIRRHFAKLSVESKSNLRLSHPSPSINGGSEVVRNQEDLSRELVNRNLCGTAETELVDPTGGAASTRSYKRQYENPMPDTGVARVPAQYVDSRNTVTTREFDVLPRDDKTMTAWKLILSSIRRQYSEIMGPQNMGSVELLALGDKPTICVTCQYPERLRRSKLEEIISPLGFPYQIGAGYINRSGGDGFVPHLAGNFFPETTESCNQLARAFQSGPALYGHYMLRPDCGASIGVHGLAALEAARVSLGGYVELRFGERWERYALTSHHLLHIDDEATGSTDDHGDRSTAFESFQETTPGVCNGIYTLDATSITVDIRSSAKTDHENELSRLMERSRWIGNNRRYGNVESGNLIKAVQSLTNSPSRFGRAIYSSGLCIEEELELQMDWLLIGNIAPNRIGANAVGDSSHFMEGRQWLRDGTTEEETAIISQDGFTDLMSYCSELDPDQIGGLSRIHGRGCESGLADGHLSRWPVLACVGGMKPTFEWSFAPRHPLGLGVPGDSGAWIFTETGALLGQILGYNPSTRMTYYTPIWALFNHIQKVTGANEVRLLPKTVTNTSDSGYESSSMSPEATTPEKQEVQNDRLYH